MGVHREDLERGGTVFLKAGSFDRNNVKRRKAHVLEILRGACKIKLIDDSTERTIRFCDLDTDDEYIAARESREAERRQKIASDHAPLKVSLGQMLAEKSGTTAQAAVALKAEPAPEVQVSIQHRDAPEVTRRFLLIMRWLTDTIYDGQWGAKAKAGRDLGISSALGSQLLAGKTGISLKRALEAGKPWGFDEAFFTGPFITPGDYAKPAPGAPVHPEQLSQQLALVRGEPAAPAAPASVEAPKILEAALAYSHEHYGKSDEIVPAAPTLAPELPEVPKRKGEFDSWLEMGREVLDREIEDVHLEWHELQTKIRDNESRMADLQKKKSAFSDVFAKLGK